MSGWGTSLNGLGSVINTLEDLTTEFDGGTVYLAGPTVRYAVFQELGTSSLEARPFMRPAYEKVAGDTGRYVREISNSQGIALNSEENIVRCAALAVQNEARKIASQKDIRDTGQMIASITIEQVS